MSSQWAFSRRLVVQKDGSRGLEASEVGRIALGGAPRLATPGSRLDHVPPQTAEHHASEKDVEEKHCRCVHLLSCSYQPDLVNLPPWPPSSACPPWQPPDTAERPTRDHIDGLRRRARPQAEIFHHDGISRPFFPRTLLHVVVACSTTQRQSFCGSEDCACLWCSIACREELQHAAAESHRLTPPSCQCSGLSFPAQVRSKLNTADGSRSHCKRSHVPPSRPIPSTFIHYHILGEIWIKPIGHRLVSIGFRYGRSVSSHVQAALHLWPGRLQSNCRVESLHCTSNLHSCHSLVSTIVTRRFNSQCIERSFRGYPGNGRANEVLCVPRKSCIAHFLLASLPRLFSYTHACPRLC